MLLTHVEQMSAGALAHHILLIEDDPASAESLKVLLEQHGFRVLQPQVYRMLPATALSGDTVEQLAMGEIDGVTLLSPRTAQVYAAVMRKQGLASVARGLVHFCLSPAVARRLEPLGTLRVQIADNPHLAEVLALIDAAAAQSES